MSRPPEEPDTEQLRAVQADRVQAEARAADDAVDAEEQRAHARRSDKAAYLRDRLAEKAKSEREAENEAGDA